MINCFFLGVRDDLNGEDANMLTRWCSAVISWFRFTLSTVGSYPYIRQLLSFETVPNNGLTTLHRNAYDPDIAQIFKWCFLKWG
jgi:hypothetical protein